MKLWFYFRVRPVEYFLAILVSVVGVSLNASPVVEALVRPAWVQDSFEDFAAGKFDDGGANFYVAHGGTIQSVNRFDLNNDGFVDLVFNSSLDEQRAIQPTCVEVAAGQRQTRALTLPTYGTSAAVITKLMPEHCDENTSSRRWMCLCILPDVPKKELKAYGLL